MTNAAAWSLWFLGGVAILANALGMPDWLGHFGMVLGAAAGTVHIRGFFCAQAEMVRNAYNLGRDAAGTEVPFQRTRR